MHISGSFTSISPEGSPILDCSEVPTVGRAQTLIWPYSCVYLPPVSMVARARAFCMCEHSLSFYIFHKHRVHLVDHVDLICSLFSCTACGRILILFPSHSDPRAQLWFYHHICMKVVHRSLFLSVPWRTWVCPSEDQVWSWSSCLDHGDICRTRYSG